MSTDDTIIIKKYANRRLYNTSTSKYIVLTDVVKLIEDGVEFRIEDAKSGEDLTRAILNQIIFEKETQSGEHFFPLDFQKQLIRFYNDTYGAMVPDYLAKSMAFFTEQRASVTEDMASVMAKNTKALMSVSQEMAAQNVEIMKQAFGMFMPGGSPSKPASEKPPENAAPDPNFEALQEQVDALQDQLKQMKSTSKE
ncbi:MAG: polyhydroxyalkanoate synthesis repressor PhaR [Pseudomonadota bacterium]